MSFIHRLHRRPLGQAFAAWLIVALCLTQSLGFLHAIAHGGVEQGTAQPRVEATDAEVVATGERSLFTKHSCAAFDAAALGTAAPSGAALFVPACDAPASFAPPGPRQALPIPRFGYLSRAPPSTTA